MSRAKIIIFVEGLSDRFFYGELASFVCRPTRTSYQIRTATEVGESGNGKPKLVALFQALKRQRALNGTKKNQASVFFFLDKDLDDLKGNMISSRHLAYTDHYAVENYYFVAGDLVRASAAIASLEVRLLERAFGDLAAWRRSAAISWKEWVELCVHASLDGISCRCHFRSNSKVHKGGFAALDKSEYTRAFEELKQGSGTPAAAFRRRHDAIRKIVEGYYAEGKYDSLFNGSWYPTFVQATVVSAARHRTSRAQEVSRRIIDALLPTINFDGSWCENLRRPLNALASRSRT